MIYSMIAFVMLSSACYAGVNIYNLNNDPSRKDYYDERGQHQGYSKKQPYSDRTEHYNAWGQQEGYSKKDPYSSEVKDYDWMGQYQGSTS